MGNSYYNHEKKIQDSRRSIPDYHHQCFCLDMFESDIDCPLHDGCTASFGFGLVFLDYNYGFGLVSHEYNFGFGLVYLGHSLVHVPPGVLE